MSVISATLDISRVVYFIRFARASCALAWYTSVNWVKYSFDARTPREQIILAPSYYVVYDKQDCKVLDCRLEKWGVGKSWPELFLFNHLISLNPANGYDAVDHLRY